MSTFSDLLRVRPDAKVDLADHDPDGTPGFDGDRDAGEGRAQGPPRELEKFQERFWAERSKSLLVVLQAMDAGGKDGTIRNVFTAINPQGTSVSGFGVPSEEELAHDYLWRVHARAPGKGRIGVFNRSHYEDVLVVRVAGLGAGGGLVEALRADQRLGAHARRVGHGDPQVLPPHQP